MRVARLVPSSGWLAYRSCRELGGDSLLHALQPFLCVARTLLGCLGPLLRRPDPSCCTRLCVSGPSLGSSNTFAGRCDVLAYTFQQLLDPLLLLA